MTLRGGARPLFASALLFASMACEGKRLNDVLFGPSKPANEVPPPAPPTPLPTPEPIPTPTPEPSPTPDDGFPPNTAPVAEVTARVFFIECGGTHLPDSEYATEAPVGCRLHLDGTPRDAAHQPTRPRGIPTWSLSDRQLVSGGDLHDYTPAFRILREGLLVASMEVDGYRSNDVVIRFR